MRSRLRTLLVGFLLLWLPVQGFAAGGMGFCRHELQPAASRGSAGHDQQAMHHDMQAMDMDHGCCHDHPMQLDQAQPDHQPAGQPHHSAALCDDCAFCHLGTVFPLPASATTPRLTATPVFHPFVAAHPASFIPEQPQRPPLAA